MGNRDGALTVAHTGNPADAAPWHESCANKDTHPSELCKPKATLLPRTVNEAHLRDLLSVQGQKAIRQKDALKNLNRAHRRLIERHKRKVADCDELKRLVDALLADVLPDDLVKRVMEYRHKYVNRRRPASGPQA